MTKKSTKTKPAGRLAAIQASHFPEPKTDQIDPENPWGTPEEEDAYAEALDYLCDPESPGYEAHTRFVIGVIHPDWFPEDDRGTPEEEKKRYVEILGKYCDPESPHYDVLFARTFRPEWLDSVRTGRIAAIKGCAE